MKTSVKKWIWVLSNLIASIWTRSTCRMQATFPEVWILRRCARRRSCLSSLLTISLKISVLHLCEFNTQHRRDKLIMIFIYHLVAWNNDCSRFRGRIKENCFISWLNYKPSAQPLFRGQFPWSRGCPLNRGSIVLKSTKLYWHLCFQQTPQQCTWLF